MAIADGLRAHARPTRRLNRRPRSRRNVRPRGTQTRTGTRRRYYSSAPGAKTAVRRGRSRAI